MKKIPCEKCLATMVDSTHHLPCGKSKLEILRLLYAYRQPKLPWAHVTTASAQEKNNQSFKTVTERCIFWTHPSIKPMTSSKR